MKTFVADTECYRDFWLLSLMNVKTRKVQHHMMRPGQPLRRKSKIRKLLKRNRIVTFNGNNYDMPIIGLALAGCNNDDLKEANDQIILNGRRPWEVTRAFEIPPLKLANHIDLIEVAPGVASLKAYAGRLHAPVIQDLPIDPDELVGDDVETMLRYCENDLEDSRILFKRLVPQLKLRQQLTNQYGQDLMSKSDAQIAEAVIGSELAERLGHTITKPKFNSGYLLKYKAPDFIQFEDGELTQLVADIEADDFVVTDGSGKVQLPTTLKRRVIKFCGNKYKMGIGGLHSQEKRVSHVPNDDEFVLDFDVSSYYPAIILKCKLFPKHLGPKFLKVYKAIVDERLMAKATGDKVRADTLKITINGSFGKFGSRYSILYSPDLLIQTTITGQLALLMLIEQLSKHGDVVSANTDGVVVRVLRKGKYKAMRQSLKEWEQATTFDTEETQYRAVYFRDVNNYLAIKPDNQVKEKGVFKKPGLAKNPTSPICVTAVANYLRDGKPIYDTIMGHKDVRDFLSIRKVRGGAIWATNHIGTTIRWYYSKSEKGAFHYALNGNKVPRTDGAHPLLELPKNNKIPDDLDRRWYIAEAENLLGQIDAGLV